MYTSVQTNPDDVVDDIADVKEIHEQPTRSRFRKRWIIPAFLLVAIGLGVGLGVGLTRKHPTQGGSGSGSGSSPTSPGGSNGSYWQPTAGVTWQIELLYPLNDTTYSAAIYDIDLFTNPASTIANLHSLGCKVICYFSAGSYEDFRPDASKFVKSDYGNPLEGWPGEYWLNTSSPNIRSIMQSRLDLAVTKGCDGVDPDNVDAYNNDNGFNLTEDDAVDFVTFLAAEAHSRKLAIGLKNAGAIVNQTLDLVQWEVNEQCVEYQECDEFQPFIAANKPVFHIEYPTTASAPNIVDPHVKATICGSKSTVGFSTIMKNLNLDNFFQTC